MSFSKTKSVTTVFCERGPRSRRAQLLEAADQKSELRLEAGSAFAFIERARKGLSSDFHDLLGVETLSQNPRQRALADSYGTFDCDVAGQLEKIGHGL